MKYKYPTDKLGRKLLIFGAAPIDTQRYACIKTMFSVVFDVMKIPSPYVLLRSIYYLKLVWHRKSQTPWVSFIISLIVLP